jgi:hypothetical protein
MEEPEKNDSDVQESEVEDQEAVFDPLYEMESQLREYKQIRKVFRDSKLEYDPKKLKNAIIFDNNLDPELDEAMCKQPDRYPDIQ